MQRVLTICGPTASGKTALAVELAEKLGAEIVSADSQQCYRGLDAGTAKPTPQERARAPHHLLDVADPEEQLDAARFVQLADAAIADIGKRGKRAIVAGGTGLWIRALLRGLLDAPGASPEFRAALREEFEKLGVPALHQRLAAVDPDAAARILPNDRVRIERALEVHALSGRPLSELQREHRFAEVRYQASLLYLDPLREVLLWLEKKLCDRTRHAATGTGSASVDALDGEIRRLERRCARLQQEIFNELSRWQVVQLSRHPNRPYMLDYVQRLFTDWIELHGDRSFGDDQALIGGLARFDGEPVMLIGQQKGRSTKEHTARSFGMPRPEGYRKALRLMKLAERFGRPVIAFIDTPGAYPGIDAEERGQAEAIAVCLEEMAGLLVPVISVVIGEGGSGGALAIGVCNRLLMLQYSWYSVISPESCAAILYRDSSKGEKAAEALKLTARDAYELGIVDELVEEASGGAHRDPDLTAQNLAGALRRHLRALRQLGAGAIVDDRYAKFRKIGPVTQPGANGA